jgi:hypothetical protein
MHEICGAPNNVIPLYRHKGGSLREVRCMRPPGHTRYHKGLKVGRPGYMVFIWDECENPGPGIEDRWSRWTTREKQRQEALPVKERE